MWLSVTILKYQGSNSPYHFSSFFVNISESNKPMSNSEQKADRVLSWSVVRKRANELGIPAWRLAEDLCSHSSNGDLELIGEYQSLN